MPGYLRDEHIRLEGNYLEPFHTIYYVIASRCDAVDYRGLPVGTARRAADFAGTKGHAS